MSFSSDHLRPDSPTGGPQTAQREAGPAGGPAVGTMAALTNAAWQIVATAGVVAIALGICLLVWPRASLIVVGALFGAYLLISGIFQLAGAFGAHVPGHMRALNFVSGALFLLLGLICFRGAAESILLLALWIGFGWLLRGVMVTAMAISTEGLPARGWQITFGVLTVLAGIVMISSPFGSIAVLTLVAGIWLIVLGFSELGHAIRLRSHAKGPTPAKAHRIFPHIRTHPHPQH